VAIQTYPDLPKNLAKQLIQAQKRVLEVQRRIISAEARIKEEAAELETYALSPRTWVTSVYGPGMAMDAYPPTTRISRLKESYEGRIARRPVRALAYQEALDNLNRLEKKILEEITGIRASTGRVDWPNPLPAFYGYDNVLDVGPDTKALVAALETKALSQALASTQALNDDEAPAGDGSSEALQQRRVSFASNSLKSGNLILRNGVSLTVSAWSQECIDNLQSLINEDQSGGVVGNVWDVAVGLVLTGCDWHGYQAWWTALNNNVRAELDISCFETQRVFDRKKHSETKELSSRISSLLFSTYLPEELTSLPSFFHGEVAKPSQVFRFWKEAGFSDKIAANWFLKSQPNAGLFQISCQPYGRETWSALQNSGLVLSGSDIPLAWSLGYFPRSTLADVIKNLGLNPSRRTSECHETLLSFSDPKRVIIALEPHGYENLRAILPPTPLTWTQFQGWRMQIKCMAALICALYFDEVPHKEKALLLSS